MLAFRANRAATIQPQMPKRGIMRRIVLTKVLFSFLFVSIVLAIHPAITAAQTEFHAVLTLGGKEGGPVLGRADFQLSASGAELHYKIEVHNLQDITMVHLHLGPIGTLTTAVAWLYPKAPPPELIPGEFSGVLAEGTLTAKDLMGPLRGQPLSALVDQMRQGNVYVNIHGKRFAAGEICGPVQCPSP